MNLIVEENVSRLDKLQRKEYPMKQTKKRRTRWTEEERQKMKSLFEEFDGDIGKISKELRRGERSVRMNLFFMDLIKESEVD